MRGTKAMKKKLYLLLLGTILFLIMLETKVNAATTASSWTELKNEIENTNETDLEINLSGTEWTANDTITIAERKNGYYYRN